MSLFESEFSPDRGVSMHSSGPRAKTKRHVSMTKFKTKPRSCTDDERALLCVLQRYFTSGRKENLIVRNRQSSFQGILLEDLHQ